MYPFCTNLLSGQRYTIGTETAPLPATADIMQKFYDHWFDVTQSVISVTGVIGSLAWQPMPKTITSKAKAKGGVRHYQLLHKRTD